MKLPTTPRFKKGDLIATRQFLRTFEVREVLLGGTTDAPVYSYAGRVGASKTCTGSPSTLSEDQLATPDEAEQMLRESFGDRAFYTERTLLLSTGHVSRAESEKFDAFQKFLMGAAGGGAAVEEMDNAQRRQVPCPFPADGWMFTCSQDDNDLPDQTEYPGLYACLHYAFRLGVEYVRFDSAGHVLKELPAYEW